VATTLIGYGALLAFVSSVGYEQETVQATWLLFVGLLPFCWSRISEAIFIGLERAKYVALVSVPVNIAQTIAAFLLLRSGYGIGAVAFSLAIAFALIAAIQSVVIAIRIRPRWIRPNIGVAIGIVRSASPFLGIEGTLVLRSSSSLVIISLVLGEAAVGIYSAAAQLQMPLRLIGGTVGTGLFPVMVRAFNRSVASLAKIANRAVELIIALLFPAVVGLVILAPELLALIFGGEGFAESVTVLRLVSWAGLAMAVASILGRALVSANRELLTLRIAIINTTVQILLAVVLTIQFGLVGAAAAALLVSLLNVVQHYAPMSRLLGGFPLWPMVWRPILASAVMAVALIAIRQPPIVVRVVVGAAVYAAALVGVSLWSAGGMAGLRQRWMFADEIEGPTA